ncbi:hypothetical protein FACS189434_09170 [Bacteroidia bacterium]|nr:hypothetical protein FACS189434_09170 [Bacteroidia bacterium]
MTTDIPAILTPETITAIAKSIALEMHITDVEKPLYMSQNKAFGRYGAARVKRWIYAGKVHINDTGGKYDLRFEDLERAAISEEYTHGVVAKRKYIRKQLLN